VSAGSNAAIIAAAAAAEQARQEEEELTPYSNRDLADDYEFKFLRSSTGAFKNAEKLRALLDDEARAGWSLVEKFDNHRIRLKRPASARQLDGKLDFDPYRTSVGTSDAALAFVILGVVFGALGLIIALIALLSSR
jgi:hypothetical protein